MPTPKQSTCINCGRPRKSWRHSTCGRKACADKARQLSDRRRRDEYKRNGLCEKCGKPNLRDTVRCERCVSKVVVSNRRRASRHRKRGACTRCGGKVTDGAMCKDCQEQSAKWAREKRAREKVTALEAYGGCVCACCGENEITMLTLDHIEQNGTEDRRNHPKYQGTGVYVRLRKDNYPSGFRVLCYNCNIATFRSDGHVCPHKTGCFA